MLHGGGWGPSGSRVSPRSQLVQPGCRRCWDDAGMAELCLRQQRLPVKRVTAGCGKPEPPSCLSANAHLITQQPGVAEARAAGELRFSSNRFPSPAQEPEEEPFSYRQINRQVVLPCPSPSPALLSPSGLGMLCKARVGLGSVPGGFCTSSPILAAVCPTHVWNGRAEPGTVITEIQLSAGI